MKKQFEIDIFVVFATLSLILLCSSLASSEEKQLTLIGVVVDDNGRPIPGAYLTLKGPSLSEDRHALSLGMEGKFEFSQVPSGKEYSLSASVQDFHDDAYEHLCFVGNDEIFIQMVLLYPGPGTDCVFPKGKTPTSTKLKEGRVIDAKHRPLHGVRLTLFQGSNSWITLTDKNGKFKFKNSLQFGEAKLLAELDGYIPRSKIFWLDKCANPPAIQLSLLHQCN